MIKKKNQRSSEVRKNMRGAPGEVTVKHYFKKEETNIPCRLCAELIIPPGTGIGLHEHVNEDEIYIIQHGKGVITDNGKDTEIEAGDSIITGKGGSHAVRNTGKEDLVITAIIVEYTQDRFKTCLT